MTINDLLRRLSGCAGRALGAAAFVAVLGACQPSDAQQGARNLDDVEIGVLHVQGNVYALFGPDSNITVQAGREGILIVDAMSVELSDKVVTAIRGISDQPLRYIVNTHYHPDHTGGNASVSRAGQRISDYDVAARTEAAGEPAPIIAHENVLMTLAQRDSDPEGWPFSTYPVESRDMYLNGEAIFLLHEPNAHTNGDSIVHFRGSDVISTGDIFSTVSYPYIDVENGGTIRGIIDALNHIIDIAVPAHLQEGGTMIIPGHGRLADEADVLEYRDMLTLIASFIQAMIDEGRSLREVQQARPTLGWDGRYGSDSGAWTTEQFVETIYRELAKSD